MSTIKLALAICLAFLLLAGPALAQGREGPGREAPAEVRGVVKSVAGDAITLTFADRREPAVEKTFTLAKDVEVALAAAGGRGGLFKEGKLTDLTEGVRVALSLSHDKKTVESIVAEGVTIRGILKAVDATKNSLTIAQAVSREGAEEEKTYTLAPGAEVVIDDGRGRRFSIKEVALADVPTGALVNVWLTADQKQVQALMAEGPTYSGAIKSIDAAKKTLTLVTHPARGDDGGEEKTLSVPKEAMVLIDDGQGRRLSLKEAKLTDVPSGAAAVVRMSVDQNFVMFLKVEGPTLMGALRGVDAEKGTIILALPKGRGEDPEEKKLTLVKGVRVFIDGAEGKLGDLKIGGDGTPAFLRLSLDQSRVMSIMVRTGERR
jgi:hypothetical protein